MAKYSLALFLLLGLGSKAQQQLTYEITTEWDGGALDGHDPVKITIENDPWDDSLDVTFEADFFNSPIPDDPLFVGGCQQGPKSDLYNYEVKLCQIIATKDFAHN